MPNDEEVDALAERIEIAQITNRVIKERIDELFAKLESLEEMVAE
jgi:hypothetical protein